MFVRSQLHQLLFALIAIIAPALLAAADQPGATPSSPPATTPKTPGAHAAQHLSGKIVSYDVKSSVLTIDHNGTKSPVTVSESTVVQLHGKHTTRDQLKPGLHASVTVHDQNGVKTATRIYLRENQT